MVLHNLELITLYWLLFCFFIGHFVGLCG